MRASIPPSLAFRSRTLDFSQAPFLMGVLNITPDSFSDGGCWYDEERAVARGQQLVADGADLLDIGGQSTRPGACPVSPEEEARRVVPVIRRLAAATTVPISIDTTRAAVARQALAVGAQMVNDISALAPRGRSAPPPAPRRGTSTPSGVFLTSAVPGPKSAAFRARVSCWIPGSGLPSVLSGTTSKLSLLCRNLPAAAAPCWWGPRARHLSRV